MVSECRSASLQKENYMSAFLGPIHYWVYHKIELQEEFVKDILELSASRSWDNELAHKLSEKYGTIGTEPLEDIIDVSNIHGWLQSKLSVTEGRLALAVTELLAQDAGRKDILVQTAYDFGRKHGISKEADAEKAFQAISDSLIDGMPCDGVNELLEQGKAYTSWQQTACVHSRYWEQVQGSIEVYYELRKAIIEGMLSQTNLEFTVKPDDIYELIQRN